MPLQMDTLRPAKKVETLEKNEGLIFCEYVGTKNFYDKKGNKILCQDKGKDKFGKVWGYAYYSVKEDLYYFVPVRSKNETFEREFKRDEFVRVKPLNLDLYSSEDVDDILDSQDEVSEYKNTAQFRDFQKMRDDIVEQEIQGAKQKAAKKSQSDELQKALDSLTESREKAIKEMGFSLI